LVTKTENFKSNLPDILLMWSDIQHNWSEIVTGFA